MRAKAPIIPQLDNLKIFAKWVKNIKCFYCFDTETTGLSPYTNDIIEFSAIEYRYSSGHFHESRSLDIYINPGYPLPQEIVKITGITDSTIQSKGISQPEAVEKIRNFWGDRPILVGYNSISFDQEFLDTLYRKILGIGFSNTYHIDVLKMAKEKMPAPHKLCDMAKAAKVDEGITFHTSIDDARATFGVFRFLLHMYC